MAAALNQMSWSMPTWNAFFEYGNTVIRECSRNTVNSLLAEFQIFRMQRKKKIDVKNANIQIKRYSLINISQASIFSLNLQFLFYYKFMMWKKHQYYITATHSNSNKKCHVSFADVRNSYKPKMEFGSKPNWLFKF